MSVKLVLWKACYKHCCAEEWRAVTKCFVSLKLLSIFLIDDQIFEGIFVAALPLTSVNTCEHWIYTRDVQLSVGCTATPSPWLQNKIKQNTTRLTSLQHTFETMLYFIKSVPNQLRLPSWIFTAGVQKELKSEDLNYCKTIILKTQEKPLSTCQLGCLKGMTRTCSSQISNAMSVHPMIPWTAAREFLIPYHMLMIAEYYPLTKYYCKKS